MIRKRGFPSFPSAGGASSSRSVRHWPASISNTADAIAVTLEYNYLLFKKQDTRYTYVTFGTVQALPPQSMEAIVGAARDNIKNLGYSDVGTASENLSVWEVWTMDPLARTIADVW